MDTDIIEREDTQVHAPRRKIPGAKGYGTLTPFDSASGRAAALARHERARRLYAEGAGRAVQDVQLIREYGEDAHIVERAMTMQTIATTPDAGKAAVLAAAHLDRAQGLTAQAGGDGEAPAAVLALSADALRVLAGWLGGDRREVVDADWTGTDDE